MFQEIKENNGILKFFISKNQYEFSELIIGMDDFSDVNRNKLSDISCFLEDNYSRIGFVASIHVEKELRSTGIGGKLFNKFQDETKDVTEVDLLFARVDIPQKDGFDLKTFYKKRGFESVFYCQDSGEMLMVNKNKSNMFYNNLTKKYL
jgi:GNAT superfamily N-acetyltransferase